LQLLGKMTEAAFEALAADPTAPRPRWGPNKRALPLSAIRADERAQPRAALDMDKVAEYVEAMQRGAKFPAPIVFEDAGVFWPGDGHHRIAAATELKRKTIECEVRSGGLREAILYSCGANATHGLPRTRDDKHRAVTKLLNDDEWSAWSDREIARRCKVGADLVGRLRERLKPVTVANDSEPDTVVNDSMNSPSHTDERTFIHPKTGNPATMRTANIGGRSKPEASGAEQPPPAANDTLDDVARADQAVPNPTPLPNPSTPAPAPTTALPEPTPAPATPQKQTAPVQGRFDLNPLGPTPQPSTPAPQSQPISEEQKEWQRQFEKFANSTFIARWNTEFPGWWEFDRPSHFIKMAENAAEAWASVASRLDRTPEWGSEPKEE
jgi:hypothetical protein